MSGDETVPTNYTHGDLLAAIQSALTVLGKSVDEVTIEDLAPVDEFHIGGRVATDNLLAQLDIAEHHHILDIGCGLGGAARYIADRFSNRVTGIDLTPEYIDVGNTLCAWVGLHDRVTLHKGSALGMPFEDESFDAAVMLHVGMNIEDKAGLFSEVYRVLRPGASFAVYDVMRTGSGELTYPVPWAAESGASQLASPAQYLQALNEAGFETAGENALREFALEFFQQMRARTEAEGGPPPLGLHVLMQESTGVKIKNMIENITANRVAPVEIIARKQAGLHGTRA